MSKPMPYRYEILSLNSLCNDLRKYIVHYSVSDGKHTRTMRRYSDVKPYCYFVKDLTLHREYGPAIYSAEVKAYMINNNYHREEGPAIYVGENHWYALNGEILSKDDFICQMREVKLGRFLNDD